MKRDDYIKLGTCVLVVAILAWQPKADPSKLGKTTHTFHPKGTIAEPLPVEDHDGTSPTIRGTPDGDWTDHLARVNRRLQKQKEGGK